MKTKLSVTSKYLLSLVDKSKLLILVTLAKSTNAVCASDLCKSLGQGKSLVSYHMNILVNSGLVKEECCGRFRKYRINNKMRKKIDNLFTFLEVKI